MNLTETKFGFLIETEKVLMLFGGVEGNYKNICENWPQFKFKRIKQTHSDICIETDLQTPDYSIEADAHFTQDHELGVCISTADCVPVLIYDSMTESVLAIHAGWRGVANEIIPKSIEALFIRGAQPSSLSIAIGPHIQKESFEVDLDVRDQILATLHDPELAQDVAFSQTLEKDGKTKAMVDINAVVKQQLALHHIQPDQVFDLHINTVTDLRFHSHRRDRERSGRQLSFILRKN